MNKRQQQLLLDQLDQKFRQVEPLRQVIPPGEGWLHAIRNALRMSLRQVGERLGISPQGAKELELREKEGSITLNTLREAGQSLGLELHYVFLPPQGSLEAMIHERAYQLAREIVLKTSNNMRLEDQAVAQERLERSIAMLAEEFKHKMPRNLWD